MLHTIKKSYSIKLFKVIIIAKIRNIFLIKTSIALFFRLAPKQKIKECVLTYNETTS